MPQAVAADAQRETWRSRGAFVIAAIGAAVGLGNVWRFSGVAGENGGATFLLVYLAAVTLLGIPLVIAEVATAGSMGRVGSQEAALMTLQVHRLRATP